ncbi:MAG: Gfo/Idh/MocA family oxidoreductase [Kiritimatiellae bacterium]|nr:Gfo/Idh/MocA family oxidoreductase [Kiritimatiellia bacterium]MDD5519426.1 Gfo/Idh/MocA family oxidoreductase [Kiritimatiellia bacterium]
MKTDLSISRRDFLAKSAGGVAAMTLGSVVLADDKVKGANDRINIVIIGSGGRAGNLMSEIKAQAKECNAVITGICDVYRPNRESAIKRVKEWFNNEPRETSNYEEALQWPDVDAVVIATPDFAHSPILAAAARAGKDAYCEKPMCATLDQAREAYKAVKENKRIVQIGTQRRSEGGFKAAAEVVRSGQLGKISRFIIAINVNQARWMRDYKKIKQEDVDWDRFLMHMPRRPFDPMRFLCWHLFRDYTNGLPGLWGSHYFDLVPLFTGDLYPKSGVAHGGIYVWKDGREHADTFHTLLEYPSGFLVSWAMALGNSSGGAFTIHGTNGTLDCMKYELSGEGGSGPDKIKEKQPLPKLLGDSHMKNWLECMRSRKAPTADIEAGYAHSVACCMAAEAYFSGKRMVYDHNTMELKAG